MPRFTTSRSGRATWPAVSGALSVILVLLTAAVAGRWLRESQGPFLTLYDVLLSNLFSLTLVYLVAAWLVPALRKSSAIVVAFLGMLGIWSLTVSAAAVPLPATFDNPWLWLHVTAGKLFLGLCLPAAAIIQVALGGTISDSKIGRIAGTGCERMPNHQNVTTGFYSFYHFSIV